MMIKYRITSAGGLPVAETVRDCSGSLLGENVWEPGQGFIPVIVSEDGIRAEAIEVYSDGDFKPNGFRFSVRATY